MIHLSSALTRPPLTLQPGNRTGQIGGPMFAAGRYRLSFGQPLASAQLPAVASAQFWVALREAVIEFLDCGHYGGPILALCALLLPWASKPRQPGGIFVLLLCGAFWAVLLRLSWATGYLASRHALIPVALLSPWMGAGVEMVTRGLAILLYRRCPLARPWHQAAAAVLAAAGIWFGCLPKLLQPLHATRWGHWQVGGWIASRFPASTGVIDDHAFASFHANTRRYGFKELETALHDTATRLLVVETHDLQRGDRPYREIQKLVTKLGDPVVSYPFEESGRVPGVFVYDLGHGDGLAARTASELR